MMGNKTKEILMFSDMDHKKKIQNEDSKSESVKTIHSIVSLINVPLFFYLKYSAQS